MQLLQETEGLRQVQVRLEAVKLLHTTDSAILCNLLGEINSRELESLDPTRSL